MLFLRGYTLKRVVVRKAENKLQANLGEAEAQGQAGLAANPGRIAPVSEKGETASRDAAAPVHGEPSIEKEVVEKANDLKV